MSSFVRLRLTVENPEGTKQQSLQVQIKERQTAEGGEVLYQILFPKERKGESVLASRRGSAKPSGHKFLLPDKLTALDDSVLASGLFGGDLAIQDTIENFFAWSSQAFAGTEEIQGKECQILESKPGSGQWSAYGSVKSWIDSKRMVPLRVEKYGKDGRLVKRIETTRVHRDESGRYVPATMEVRKAGSSSVTELEGSKIKVGVTYNGETFTVPKMTDLAAPR